MAKNVDDIIGALPAARQRRIEQRAQEIIREEMTLEELRRAHRRTQTELAKTLGIAQKQISKLEDRTDMHISTLRRHVEAMGGTLELVARFPNHAPVMLSGLAPESAFTDDRSSRRGASSSRTSSGKAASKTRLRA